MEGTEDLYWVPADGSGEIERITMSEARDFPTSVTPDGSTVLFRRDLGDESEIWEVPLEGERTPTPVVQGGGFLRANGEVSPDGDWLAYSADQSGQMEIWLLRRICGPVSSQSTVTYLKSTC